jgi:carbon monoxide dehydrogenase subunit G
MSIRIEEVFEIQAHPDRVWDYLTDPRQVVNCLPGAELTSVQDEKTFLGRVKVKVGPISTAYAGKVVLTERDDANRVVKMTGEGRESGGAGSAKMTMTSSVVGLANGGTEVRVTADVDIVGRIAQFGRGMIESVNKQMFKQFTECVRGTLADSTASTSNASAANAARGSASELVTTDETAPKSSEPAGPSSGPPPTWGSVLATPTSGSIVPASPMTNVPPPASPAASAQPVRLVPVLFRALLDYLGGVVSRLLGRKAR